MTILGKNRRKSAAIWHEWTPRIRGRDHSRPPRAPGITYSFLPAGIRDPADQSGDAVERSSCPHCARGSVVDRPSRTRSHVLDHVARVPTAPDLELRHQTRSSDDAQLAADPVKVTFHDADRDEDGTRDALAGRGKSRDGVLLPVRSETPRAAPRTSNRVRAKRAPYWVTQREAERIPAEVAPSSCSVSDCLIAGPVTDSTSARRGKAFEVVLRALLCGSGRSGARRHEVSPSYHYPIPPEGRARPARGQDASKGVIG